MTDSLQNCCILNGSSGAWAFRPLAEQLSTRIGIPIASEPVAVNYLLSCDGSVSDLSGRLFIPLTAIDVASDKRSTAQAFSLHGVPAPQTRLLDSYSEVMSVIKAEDHLEWCLKYPTSCGGSRHRLVTADYPEPPSWPRPFVLQEFVRLERPEVYRTYCAGGVIFGWAARRFAEGAKTSPWVAHARGAGYTILEGPPGDAAEVARAALMATGLADSFGCVDLIRRPSGEWLALEVGTEGVYNHVDRELHHGLLESEIAQRIAGAFWQWVERNSKPAR